MLRLAAASALAVVAHAQTFVVDAAGGAGSQFTTIDAAVAAVPSGSTLLVRPGTYGGFTIQAKSLTVLGSPGTVLSAAAIVVEDVGATQRVVLRDLDFSYGDIAVTDCGGLVLLDHVRPSTTTYLRLAVADSTEVYATNCVFRFVAFSPQSTPVLLATDSRVALDDCTVSSIGCPCTVTVRSDLQVDSTLFSPDGASITADALSTLRLVGTSGLFAYLSPPIVGGHLRLGPNVFVSTTAPPLAPTSLTYVSDERVVVTGGALGGSVTATLDPVPNRIGVLVFGRPGPAVAVPGVADAWWMDLVESGILAWDLNVPVTATLAIPALPSLQGQTFGFQGGYLDANGLTASLPAFFVVH